MKTEIITGLYISRLNVPIVVCMCMLVVAIFFAAKWGAAAVSHEISMYYFHSWNNQNVQPDDDEWERTQKLMAWSVKFDSSNAGYINDQGRFYEYTADRLTRSQTRRIFLLIKAADNFRLASQLRPTWPVPWANLAMVKSRLDTVDDEFELAIGNAMELGKAYPVIYVPVIESAISQWHHLPVRLKAKIIYQIKVGLESSVKSDVLAVIKAHKMCLELEQQGLSINHHCYDQ